MTDAPTKSLSQPGVIEDSYPITPLQHGMIFHRIQDGASGFDIEQLVADLSEPLDAEAFRHAWGAVAAQHAILRTRFAWSERDVPVQQVLSAIEVPFTMEDLRGLPRDQLEGALRGRLSRDRARGFDLAATPLWRVELLRLDVERWRFVWTYSHALLDNAFAFVLSDVQVAYEALVSGRTPRFAERRPYRDYCVWLEGHLARTSADARAHFRRLLSGFTEPTSLAALQPRPSVAASGRKADVPAGLEAATTSFRLGRATSDALRSFKAHGIGPSVIVHAAWALVLSAFAGTDDVVFGVTRSCRRSPVQGTESMVGLLINTLPMRVQIDRARPVLEWLGELRERQREMVSFERAALVEAIAASEVPRGTPLFETLVVYNDAHADARMKALGGPWMRRSLELHDHVSFPCALMGYGDDDIHFRIEYDPGRLDGEAVERMAGLLRSVVEGMVRNPHTSVGDLPSLPEVDARRLLHEWQDTGTPVRGDPCIHGQIEAQVRATPGRRAVVFRDAAIEYAELDARATAVARKLRELGVGPGSRVGVFVERSIEMVVGLLGVLKSGGAYVPMDPAYPSERIAMMLEDCSAKVVLTLGRLRESLPPTGAAILELDSMTAQGGGGTTLGAGVSGEDVAYVIFTSGSTGRPKGVAVRHRNVTNFFAGMDRALGDGEPPGKDGAPGVWLAVTSICFDISVLELLWTLARGYTVVVQESPGEARQPSDHVETTRHTGRIDFSLFYFAAEARERGRDAYRLLLDGARFADAHGFSAVWTPERHFHRFGGLYPNPSVTSAAVAAVTERIALRAGSVVLPLHNPIRCAEEWSVVDNLSNGRVGLSFASGWHASDFALAPDSFQDRRRVMSEGIETVRKLWRGEAITAKSGDGKDVEVRIFPKPVQQEPPIWITASGSPETFAMAGRMGANVLTNLLVMKREELASNIAAYREAYRASGRPGRGHVSLMLHTFVGGDADEVRSVVRGPFLEYLRTSTDLINKTRWELSAFAKPSAQRDPTQGARDLGELTDDEMSAIMDHAFERYFSTAGLFGTPQSCLATVRELAALGVDEIACLVDFGVPADVVLESLAHLDELRALAASGAVDRTGGDYSIHAQIERHGVTHMQCTPTLVGLVADDPAGAKALGSLKTLLLGGEALPTSLVSRLLPVVKGRVFNMYGPTETTVWSTCAEVAREVGADITIGRPIANTQVYVVNRGLRPVPVGVPGELLIGGDGVSAGYLNRAELTRERFVPDTLSGRGDGLLYRTGDLARWRSDGTLEFLGRLDHQVKIRGFRIELGEIEKVLSTHPAVHEAVVVAGNDGRNEQRLVAYVRLREQVAAGADDATAYWKTIWDETYEASGTTGDAAPQLDTTGWHSSYTSQPIDDEHMKAWVAETTSRVAALAPRRVLDVGCGTGLVLFRIAPRCERYVGVDTSPAALRRLRARVDAAGLDGIVSLEELSADALEQLGDGRFDTIVLNSVAQYFPDVGHFVRVVEKAWNLLDSGGHLFVGDVRSLPLLAAFHGSVALQDAPAALPAEELRRRVERQVAAERELVLDPGIFHALDSTLRDLAGVEIRLKHDAAHLNEMTRFRYDVVLSKSREGQAPACQPETLEAPDACSIEALGALLRDAPPCVRIVGIPNARIRDDFRAVEMLARGEGGTTTGELRSTVRALPGKGLDPGAVLDLDPGYEIFATDSAAGADRFDLIARRRTEGARVAPLAPIPASEHRPWTAYANTPARAFSRQSLVGELRAHLRAKLPEFMVPSAFVALETFPQTPNGKVDRKRLPAPDQPTGDRGTTYAAPANETEKTIAAVWQEILTLERVSVEQNFFDLGANSLMMVQAHGRLRQALGRQIALVDLFRFPTVRALAAQLSGAAPGVDVLRRSQERALSRRDAMSRRRDVRDGARAKD